MTRGEVWWADAPELMGRRPIVLLSRDATYSTRNQATVASVTTRVRDIPVEVPLGRADGLPRPCVANLDAISTIYLSRLQERIAVLSPAKMQAVETALRFALALGD